MLSWLFIILAILGLSFLIFIHELGHYYMAKRVGMRVETFAIGFGKPVYSWMYDGTKWQIGWLLFGGYVKIAGSEIEGDKDPYSVPDGFFGKPPIDRIKVSFMGPLVNIVFAFIVFAALWALGGREKEFSQYTSKIGWIDPQSELYSKGIRPGDEIVSYGDKAYKGEMDHFYGPMKNPSELKVKGYHVSYATGEKTPFEYTIKPYPSTSHLRPNLLTSGIVESASYLFYNAANNPDLTIEGSPLEASGIQPGDRIAWVEGEFIFSHEQLQDVLNDKIDLLTIARGNQTLLRRVPRVFIKELKPDNSFFQEVRDWQYEANLQNTKLADLYIIPYNLTNNCVIEEKLKFLDKEIEETVFPKTLFSTLDEELKAGDKIIAINGIKISQSYDLLTNLQKNQVQIIVERDPELRKSISMTDADAAFDHDMDYKDLQKIVAGIGTDRPVKQSGKYVLLNLVIPKTRSEFPQSDEKKALYAADQLEQKRMVDAIDDPEKKAQVQKFISDQDKRLLLGFVPEDRKVIYNPTPVELFNNVFEEIWATITGLFSRSLSPKMMAGPVGIIGVVHNTLMSGFREALYWMGFISLNLGMLNLLPIPVLDGGTILLSLYELVTKRRIKPKTMERLTIPFAVALIGLFIFLTYNDINRLLGSYFG